MDPLDADSPLDAGARQNAAPLDADSPLDAGAPGVRRGAPLDADSPLDAGAPGVLRGAPLDAGARQNAAPINAGARQNADSPLDADSPLARGGRLPVEVGFQRLVLPDPEAVGEDAELVAWIRAEIAETGPITFARFMERALYEPDHGYYRRAETGPGTAGDFLTAPEAHPIFGAAIGRLLEQAWEAMGRPERFTVTEPGAGTGALAAGLLGGLRDLGSPFLAAINYRPVEVEPARIATFRDRLTADGFAGHLAEAGPEAGDTGTGTEAEPTEAETTETATTETGAVIANEVLDALPVHRVIGRPNAPDGIRELLVGLGADGRFAPVEADPSTPDLAARLADESVTLADGQVTEICLAIDGWLAGATRHLAAGLVVLVDYADEPAALHGPSRPRGSLRAFARHAVSGDPYRHVGRQDLTATVDLAAVRAAAARAGLVPVGETTQAELLAAVGSAELTGAWLRRPGATIEDALHLRSALVRLMDPRGMGGFRVLVFGKGLPAGTHLPGLARVRRSPGAQTVDRAATIAP